MELVGAHQILGFLADLPLDGRQQLRGHGRVQNVRQDCGKLGVLGLLVVGDEADQMPHQGLGDAGVDGVVAHVVAVVGAPAQGQLAEVPGADDQTSGSVGDVHEHLGPLPGLGVLIGDGVVLRVVADVLEVAADAGGDVHGPQGGPQPLRQQHRVGLGPVRGAEAGHGDGDDVGGGPVQHLHGQGRNQHRQGGVQAAGGTHHGGPGAGVLQPLLQAQGGDAQNLAAPVLAALRVLRHERGGGDVAGQVGSGQVHVEGNPPDLRRLFRGGVGVHPAALGHQLFHINLTDGQARGEAPLRQQDAVFRDHVVAGKHQVRGGLALSGVGVHIAAHQPAGLAGHQGPAVGGLAHGLIGGGQVQNDGGTLPGQHGGGRLRGPQVLTDLHTDHQTVQPGAGKNPVAAEIDLLAAEGHIVVHTVEAAGGRKPPLLVKLPVIGQIGLGHQAQNLSFLYNSGAVIQFVVPFIPDRQAQSGHHVQILGGLQDGPEALLGAPEQGVLQKQVPAGIPGQAQLRQDQHLDTLLVGLPHKGEDLFGVVAAIGHPDLGGAGGHGDKTVFHL